MTREQYQKEAERTCPSLKYGQAADNLHMASGMIDEWFEYVWVRDRPGIVNMEECEKELGDVFWYLANYCRMNKIGFNYAEYNDLPIEQNLSRLLGIHKKELAYNKTPNFLKCQEYIRGIIHWLDIECKEMGLPPYDIFDLNISKLRKIYPIDFDAKLARNRTE